MATENDPSVAWTADERRLRWRIFWVALVVRVLYMTLAHTYHVRPAEDHFQYGWEMGRIARALVTGYGYSDPFTGHTGPTAWLPPLYVFLMAGAFKLCGVYSAGAAWVLLALNSVLSASTAVAVWEIARRCFSAKVALWSGWMWALHPAAMQYAVRWIWEMTVTTWLLTWIFVLALRMRTDKEGQSWRRWFVFGLLWGVLALSSPTPLILLPVLGLWVIFAPGFESVRVGRAALAGLVFCAVLAPWTVRNWVVFHKFIPLRGNFGAENYMGNADWSDGFPWGTAIPIEKQAAQQDYATMGEPGFVADRGAKANAWIATHRGRFVQLSLKRAYLFWAGVPHPLSEGAAAEYIREISFQFLSLAGWFGVALAVRRRRLASWVMLAAFLFFPITYYMVTVQARFRHPLEPLICVLGVFLFQSAEPGKFGRWAAAKFAWLGRLTAPLRPWFRGEMTR
jgi:hypothetical protein